MARKLDRFPSRSIDEPCDQLSALERRLEDGYLRISLALDEGKDVSAWETFWIDLLHQYETLADGLIREQAA